MSNISRSFLYIGLLLYANGCNGYAMGAPLDLTLLYQVNISLAIKIAPVHFKGSDGCNTNIHQASSETKPPLHVAIG